MPARRLVAVVLGLLTLAPWCWFLYLAIEVRPWLLPKTTAPTPPPSLAPELLGDVLVHLLMAALIVVLTVFYFIHLFFARRGPRETRLLWAVALLFGNVLAMTLYWYLHVWREGEG
jgi:hypothetical protein